MLWFVVIGLLLPLVMLAILFNRLVRSRNMMREAWGGMDVQLKRRHDLVPNLVDVVKSYARHEKELLKDVSEMRADSMDLSRMHEAEAAEDHLTDGLKNILAVVENYPDLKADKNFRDLQASLIDVEDHIQMARRYFNGSVRNFNIQVESFPSNLVARGFGFEGAEFFELDTATEGQAPVVDLAS